MSDYLIINNVNNKKGEDTIIFKENDGELIIKQYSGFNTDNFIIKKFDGKQFCFSFFKINGIHYINIDNKHIIDYKKFVNIQHISNVESDNNLSSIKILNIHIGAIIINNCDIEIFSKALSVMNNYMKNHKSSYISQLIYILNN